MVCIKMRIMMSSQWHGGKGSAPRKNADQQSYADNWDRIFGQHKRDTEKYLDTLKKRGVEPPHKKHYGDKHD